MITKQEVLYLAKLAKLKVEWIKTSRALQRIYLRIVDSAAGKSIPAIAEGEVYKVTARQCAWKSSATIEVLRSASRRKLYFRMWAAATRASSP